MALRALPEGCCTCFLQTRSTAFSRRSAALGREAFAVRGASLGQCFVVGEEPMSMVAFADVERKLRPHAVVVDQRHGRVRIAIAGVKAAPVLAKGTAVDLALNAFPIGCATTTLSDHIATHITRYSEDGFELMVFRGFAESRWDELAELSADFC